MKTETKKYWFEVGKTLSMAIIISGFFYKLNGFSELFGLFIVLIGMALLWLIMRLLK